jgi:hypothetical protein
MAANSVLDKTSPSDVQTPPSFFPLTKRLLRPAFSNCTLFLLLLVLCYFQYPVKDPSIPCSQVTLPIRLLGYSGRFIRPIVCA